MCGPSDRDDDMATDASGFEPADRVRRVCELVGLLEAGGVVPGSGELGEAFEAGVVLLAS